MTMKIYHYHPDTGEHVGTGQARKDPLEQDRYLIPANATDIAPPDVATNEVAVFVNGAWQVMKDHRNTVLYDKADASELTIESIGPLPDGYTDKVPSSSQDTWDEATLSWITPPPPPITVSAWQMRKAINALGYRTAVNDLMNDPNTSQDIKDGWEVAREYVRDHPDVISMAQALGMTEADMDVVFEKAETL